MSKRRCECEVCGVHAEDGITTFSVKDPKTRVNIGWYCRKHHPDMSKVDPTVKRIVGIIEGSNQD